MNKPAITQRLQKHRQAARRARRSCYLPGCRESAIWSHLLQKKGLLDQIAVNDRVIELREDNLFETGYYFSKPIHINDAFTFLGFCPRHDHELFRDIENGRPDFAKRNVQALLSYRALLNELQKMENNIAWYQRILTDNELMRYINEPRLRDGSETMMVRAAIFRQTKAALEAELGLVKPSSAACSFAFKVLTMDRIEVCTSATYSEPMVLDNPDTAVARARAGEHIGIEQPCYFVNILPTHKVTTIILGFHGPDAPSFPADGSTLDIAISDLLIKRIETWAISPAWYQGYLRPHQDEVLHEIKRLLPWDRKHEISKINLFRLR